MLLIISNSFDVTTDVLVERIRGDLLFRFNVDLAASYNIRFSIDGFEITDPVGRTIQSSQLTKAYWRKVSWPDGSSATPEDKYFQQELSYLIREMASWLKHNKKLVLVEPYAERRVGKLVQLEVAKRYLNVPAYEVVLNSTPMSVDAVCVTKSLSGATIGGDVLYTSKVDTSLLDTSSLWFLQNLIEGGYEVTVAVVRDKIFAYRLERNHPNDALDWREFISDTQEWKPFQISKADDSGIRCVMKELKLHYARFDFIQDMHENLQFCELNPNGQFAWLDREAKTGLLTAVLEAISPTTQAIPIPS